MKAASQDRRRPAGLKNLRCALVLLLVAGLSVVGLHAQPTGGTVVSGSATITAGTNSTVVTAGNNSVLHWGSFDVPRGETVQFIQPTIDSRVLNFIGGLTPSQINGSLLANGQVYLMNPYGIYFGNSAVVDVGHMYAVGGTITKEDFLAGVNHFTDVKGDVVNAGSIRGDFIALVGRSVANSGSIVSPGGFIGLASGDEVMLGENGSSIYVNTGTSAAKPANAGTGVSRHTRFLDSNSTMRRKGTF